MKSKLRKTLVGVLISTSLIPMFFHSEKLKNRDYAYASIKKDIVQEKDYRKYDSEIQKMLASLENENEELIYDEDKFYAFKEYFGYPLLKKTTLEYVLQIPVVKIPYSFINFTEMKNFYNFVKYYSEFHAFIKNPENPLYDDVPQNYPDLYGERVLSIAKNQEFKFTSEKFVNEELGSFFGPINVEGLYYIFKVNDFFEESVKNRSLSDIINSLNFIDELKNVYRVTQDNPGFDFIKALLFAKLLNSEYLKENVLWQDKQEVEDFAKELGYEKKDIEKFFKENQNLKEFIETFYSQNSEEIKTVVAVANFELEKHLKNSLNLFSKRDNEFFKYLNRNEEFASDKIKEQYKRAFGNLLLDVAYNEMLATPFKDDKYFSAFKNTGMFMNLHGMYREFLNAIK